MLYEEELLEDLDEVESVEEAFQALQAVDVSSDPSYRVALVAQLQATPIHETGHLLDLAHHDQTQNEVDDTLLNFMYKGAGSGPDAASMHISPRQCLLIGLNTNNYEAVFE